MSDFMRQHVGLREIAGRAELPVQLVEEAQVEIDLAIAGTVKRAGRGARQPARRLNAVAEQHRARRLIVPDLLRPRVLDVAHHRVDEIDELLFFGRRRRRTLGDDIGRAAATADDIEKIDAGQPRANQQDDDAADAERNADPAAHCCRAHLPRCPCCPVSSAWCLLKSETKICNLRSEDLRFQILDSSS